MAWRSLIDESSLPPQCRALMPEILYLLPRLSWWLADGEIPSTLGAQIDAPRRSLRLAPPRVPVKVPLFGKLYTGQVEFVPAGSGVELRLTKSAWSGL